MGSEQDKHLKVPFDREEAVKLRAGDYVYLSGTIYTARTPRTKECMRRCGRRENYPLIYRIT